VGNAVATGGERVPLVFSSFDALRATSYSSVLTSSPYHVLFSARHLYVLIEAPPICMSSETEALAQRTP
jgi:hypothetical protein